MPAKLEPIVGRYMTLALGGRPHRALFRGGRRRASRWCACTPPAPTAGSSATSCSTRRSPRHYRVLAFDMPWHGKSLPPEGWQREEYRLTTAAYTEMVVAFCEALELERPVVMGCSIGGRIVLNLAIEHAARFRALIGLEAADFQQPWYDTAWLNRPDVHGGEVCAALVSGLIAPQSPDVVAARDAVDVQAGRARRVQGRPLFLSRRRRPARRRSAPSIPRCARCICSPASTTSPARPRTRCARPGPSPAPR